MFASFKLLSNVFPFSRLFGLQRRLQRFAEEGHRRLQRWPQGHLPQRSTNSEERRGRTSLRRTSLSRVFTVESISRRTSIEIQQFTHRFISVGENKSLRFFSNLQLSGDHGNFTLLSLRKRLCQTLGFLKLSSGHMKVFKKTKTLFELFFSSAISTDHAS